MKHTFNSVTYIIHKFLYYIFVWMLGFKHWTLWFRRMTEPMSAGFKSGCKWWFPVELSRRFLLLLMAVLFPGSIVRKKTFQRPDKIYFHILSCSILCSLVCVCWQQYSAMYSHTNQDLPILLICSSGWTQSCSFWYQFPRHLRHMRHSMWLTPWPAVLGKNPQYMFSLTLSTSCSLFTTFHYSSLWE